MAHTSKIKLRECKDIQGKVTDTYCMAVKVLIDDIDNRKFRNFISEDFMQTKNLKICRECTKFTAPPQPDNCTVEGCDRGNYRRGLCNTHFAKEYYKKFRAEKKAARAMPLDMFTQSGGELVFPSKYEGSIYGDSEQTEKMEDLKYLSEYLKHNKEDRDEDS